MPVFLFTDIEGSTQLWERHGRDMAEALSRHDAILHECIIRHGGKIIKHTGDGAFAMFEGGDPLQCALTVQMRLAAEQWGAVGELRIRVALHLTAPGSGARVSPARALLAPGRRAYGCKWSP